VEAAGFQTLRLFFYRLARWQGTSGRRVNVDAFVFGNRRDDRIGNLLIALPIELSGGKTMNRKVVLLGRDQIPDSLKTLVYRHLRKRR
jgi:hypothetical protein